MISKKIEDALNAQINAEFWSAYLYLAMACHFESVGRKGVANWFRVQFKEEQAHAEILINHVTARGGRVELRPVDGVPSSWETVLDAFIATLDHEGKVTASINALYALAEEEHDFATRQMLNWFVAEQVEEEDSVRDIIDNLRLIGDSGVGLYQIDSELGSRSYVAPAILKG